MVDMTFEEGVGHMVDMGQQLVRWWISRRRRWMWDTSCGVADRKGQQHPLPHAPPPPRVSLWLFPPPGAPNSHIGWHYGI